MSRVRLGPIEASGAISMVHCLVRVQGNHCHCSIRGNASSMTPRRKPYAMLNDVRNCLLMNLANMKDHCRGQ